MRALINIIIILLLSSSVGFAQSLKDYFKIAAENNPGLQSKYKDFESALKRIPQVSTLPDPNLSFGYFISPVETRVGPQRAKISLSQMFPWFGTLTAQEDAAARMAEAKYQAFLDARNALYFKVASAYYPLYELNKWKKIEKENIEILNSYLNISNKKFENGTGSMVDVLRVDLLLKESQTNLEILNKKEQPLRSRFNALLNRNEGEAVNIAVTEEIPAVSENFRKDSLLANNPVLKAIKSKISASEAQQEVARKQGLPKLGIGLDYAIIGKRDDVSMPDNGKDALMPMVSVSIPIFRKKYQAAVEEAQLNQESYQLQKKEMENSLIASYEDAHFGLQKNLEQVKLYKQQIAETEQALNLLFTAYGNSGKAFEEVLRMQQKLLKFEKLLATAKAEYHIALAHINYLTSKNF
jgi:outer membrane protein TolC